MITAFIDGTLGPFARKTLSDRLPFRQSPPPGGYPSQIDVEGTAHFTRRSIVEAIGNASSGSYSALAIELDRARFDELTLGSYYVHPAYRAAAEGEFVAATDAFGNRDGDIWLIDIGIDEIWRRISSDITEKEYWNWRAASSALGQYERLGIRLWEQGRKEEAMRYLGAATHAMKEYSPTVHRVLIEERNVIMAARLMEAAQITSGRILALVGMAHVPGIRELLSSPHSVGELLERYQLNYSPPVRIRRARVN